MSGRRRLLRVEIDGESSGEQVLVVPGARCNLQESVRQDLDETTDSVKVEQVDSEMEWVDEERREDAARASTSYARPQPVRSRAGSGRSRLLVGDEWISSLRGLPSLEKIEDVCQLIELRHLGGIDFLIPGPFDRPWRAPEGYFTVYEAFFLSGLTFPLPQLIVDYCYEREMAISQLTASAIHNIVTLCDLASICGIEVDLPFLEEVTGLAKCRDYPGAFYLSMKRGIICGAPNKIYNWKYRYFYVKMNRASLVEDGRPVRQNWNALVGGCLTFFPSIKRF